MTEPLEEDQAAITLEHIRARITPDQHELLRRLWDGGDHLGWVTAKSLFHKLPAANSRRALEGRGGSRPSDFLAIGSIDPSSWNEVSNSDWST